MRVTIELSAEMYSELQAAAKACAFEETVTPRQWVFEAVLSALASRRLPRFAKPVSASGAAAEPVEHRIAAAGLASHLRSSRPL